MGSNGVWAIPSYSIPWGRVELIRDPVVWFCWSSSDLVGVDKERAARETLDLDLDLDRGGNKKGTMYGLPNTPMRVLRTSEMDG